MRCPEDAKRPSILIKEMTVTSENLTVRILIGRCSIRPSKKVSKENGNCIARKRRGRRKSRNFTLPELALSLALLTVLPFTISLLYDDDGGGGDDEKSVLEDPADRPHEPVGTSRARNDVTLFRAWVHSPRERNSSFPSIHLLTELHINRRISDAGTELFSYFFLFVGWSVLFSILSSSPLSFSPSLRTRCSLGYQVIENLVPGSTFRETKKSRSVHERRNA